MWELRKLSSKASEFSTDESGATAVEYAIIAGIMGVGIIGALQTLEVAVDTSVTTTGDAVDSAYAAAQ